MKGFGFKTIILLSVWFATMALVSGFGLAQTKPAAEQQIPQLLFVQNAVAVMTDKSGQGPHPPGFKPDDALLLRPARTPRRPLPDVRVFEVLERGPGQLPQGSAQRNSVRLSERQ